MPISEAELSGYLAFADSLGRPQQQRHMQQTALGIPSKLMAGRQECDDRPLCRYRTDTGPTALDSARSFGDELVVRELADAERAHFAAEPGVLHAAERQFR